jgi:hypothetical protein
MYELLIKGDVLEYMLLETPIHPDGIKLYQVLDVDSQEIVRETTNLDEAYAILADLRD